MIARPAPPAVAAVPRPARPAPPILSRRPEALP